MNKKKVTAEVDRKLADEAHKLARRRGQTLGQFHASLYNSALSADRFLEWAKVEAV